MKKLLLILPLVLIVYFLVACQDKAAKKELEAIKARQQVELQNKELMSKAFEEWNKGNFDFFMEMTTPDYAYYSPSANPTPMTKEDAIESVKMFKNAFPDIVFSIEDMVAEGNKLTTRFFYWGTHKGEFMGIPGTGNKIEGSGIIISRIEDGKFAEEWEEMDMMDLMMQLGMEMKPKQEK